VSFRLGPYVLKILSDQALRDGVTFKCVVSDGDYGDNPNFLIGLEERHLLYNCAVRCEFSLALGSSAKHEAIGAAKMLDLLPASCWETIPQREGSRGKLRAKFCALRCWRVDGDETRHLGWLIGQRPARSQQG
jgi:hypothetical protein